MKKVIFALMLGMMSVYADELACWADTIPYEILTSIRTSAYQAAPEKIP